MMELPDENVEQLKHLYGKCPFCFNSEMNVSGITPNENVQGVIRWFERQRAYRAEVLHL